MPNIGFSIGEYEEVLDVRRYRVPDTGTSDATEQIQTLLNTGRTVRLKRGATYLISSTLVLQAGQTLYGNGATLKRAPQVSTTATQPFVSGSTYTVLVANPSVFRPNMHVTFVNGASYDTSNRLISGINGNALSLTTSAQLTATGTTTVYSSFVLLDATAADVRVYDLTIDGNRSNWAFARWEITKDVMFGGDRSLFQGVRVSNAPGEAFVSVGTGDHITFRDCWVENANGNGWHLSGNAGCVVDGCRVVNCNLDTNVGHADGCIILSDDCADTTVSNCYCENGVSGIGSIDAVDNSDVTIIGNTIRSCTSSAIDAISDNKDQARIVIANNRIYDSVHVAVSNTNVTPSLYPNRVIIEGNYLKNTKISVQRARHVHVTNNILEDTGDTTTLEIDLNQNKYVTVTGNTVIGGDYGVYIQGSDSESILVHGNQFHGQDSGAVNQVVASLLNIEMAHNDISNTSAAHNNYQGLTVRSGGRAHGNRLNLNKGTAGIMLNDGAIGDDNLVRHGTATYSIRAPGGTNDIICQNNYVTTAASNGNGAGTNVFANNLVIP